jgi:hypothetical protein
MKCLSLFFLFIFSYTISNAQTNTVIDNNGKWNDNTTWSLNHQPVAGETVVVPKNYTVVVDRNINMDPSNIVLQVAGTLSFDVGKLTLGSGSLLTLLSGGALTSTQGNASDKLEIGGVSRYSGVQGIVSGPALITMSSVSILPVKFIAFTVAHTNNGIEVQWTTAEEMNADKYVIERSEDGNNWKSIGYVTAVGNSNVLNQYRYSDQAAISRITYYRVKQIDVDGHFVYTAIKAIRSGTETAIDVKMYASGGNIVIELPKQINGSVSVRLFSVSGQLLLQKNYNNAAGQLILAQASYKGNYVVSVSNGADVKMAKQVIL